MVGARSAHSRSVTVQFRRYYVDTLAQASYLIADGDEAAVVDPRRDVDDYLDFARREGLRIRWALATHVHADFVAGLAELRAACGAEIVMGDRFDGGLPCRRLAPGDELTMGELAIAALPTPGHTPESVCYLVRRRDVPDAPPRLLSGDTLFIGDVGRPDLVAARGFTPADMARSLWHSLHEVLAPLPDATEVWPAHGAGSACGTAIGCDPSSTLGLQRAGNWAFGIDDPAAFAARLVEAQRRPPRYFAHAAGLNRAGPRLLRDLPRPRHLDAGAVAAAQADGALILDLRTCVEHGGGHWPGALNVGLAGGDFEPWCGALIEPGRPVVLHGVDAERAEQAWLRLLRIGCESVVGWTQALPERPVRLPQIDPTALAARLQQQPDAFQVIDVRRPAEYAAGHVPGAVHAELGPELAAAPVLGRLDRQRPTAVFCLGGYRSSAATRQLADAGFAALHNVPGGWRVWSGSGLPVARATGSS